MLYVCFSGPQPIQREREIEREEIENEKLISVHSDQIDLLPLCNNNINNMKIFFA